MFKTETDLTNVLASVVAAFVGGMDASVNAILRGGMAIYAADKANPETGWDNAVHALEMEFRKAPAKGSKGYSKETAKNYANRAASIAHNVKNVKGFTNPQDGEEFATFAERNLEAVRKYWQGKGGRLVITDFRKAGPNADKGKARNGKGKGNATAETAGGNAMTPQDTAATLETESLVLLTVERLGKGEIMGDALAMLADAVANAIKAEADAKAKAAKLAKAA